MGRSISFIINFTIVDCLRGGEQSLSKARVYSYNVDGYNLIFSFEATDDGYKVEDHIIYNLKKKCKCGEKK